MYTIRTMHENDVPAAVALINTTLEADGLPDRVNEDMLRFMMYAPHAHLDEDFFLAFDHDNQLIGLSAALVNPRTGSAFGNLSVHPQYHNTSLGADLLQRTDAQILKRGEREVPADQPLYITRQTLDTQTYDCNLLESCGYEAVRTFYEMHIVFGEQIEQPEFPEGVEIRPFDKDQHARAVHAAQQEAFRDHWGHSEDTPFEEWVKRFESPVIKPEMYYIAWDGDEVAGVVLCNINEGEPDMGWVDILGVRRPWRKQGLGMALLRYSFYRFQQQGLIKGGLGVDAASKTNAVALYERAGMHIRKKAIAYRKVFRGTPVD